MTAVSTLRVDLTFIVIYFLKLTLPQYYFNKLLPENPRIHADSRTFKNIQGFVNTLDILESS